MKKINYQQGGLNVHLISALAILTAIASPWFDLSVSNHSFVKTYIAGIGIIILVLISFWSRRDETNTTFHISTAKSSLLALFALGSLSIFWSVNVDFTITKWMIWFTIFCAFVVGYHLKIDEKTLIKLSWGLLIAAFTIAAIGILQYLFDPFTLTQAASPSSTFGNKNMTTQPIVLIWPLALFLLFSNQVKGKQVWILTILTSLLMIFVFYTKTRSSWLSIVGEIILLAGFLIIKRKQLRSWIAWDSVKTKATLFAVVLFAIMININDQGLVSVTSQAGATFDGAGGSGQARLQIWTVAIDMIKATPIFGTGLGSWFHNEIQGGFGVHNVMSYQRAHNDFLELGVEVGIVGMVLLLIGALSLSIAAFKILLNDNKTNAWFYFLLWVGLSGSFVQMQFSFPYQLAMPALLFGLYAGLIAKQSENFIKPLKLIKRKTTKIYHQSVKAVWLLIFIVVSSIYIEWINTYSALNKINIDRKFNQIEHNLPSIYHLELQNILGFLAQAYLKANRPDEVIIIEENVLKYWPNANNSLYRYGYALSQKKRMNDALKVIQHLKQVAGRGNYNGHALELQLYQRTGQLDKYRLAFNEFIKIDESLLALSSRTYQLLISFSLYKPEFFKHTLSLYNKYTQYHGYSCTVENNIASFYINQKQYLEAQKHVDIITSSANSACLKSQLVQILNNKLSK